MPDSLGLLFSLALLLVVLALPILAAIRLIGLAGWFLRRPDRLPMRERVLDRVPPFAPLPVGPRQGRAASSPGP